MKRKDNASAFAPFCGERKEGAWSIAGMAMQSQITLHNQERGKEWEFRVIAVNKIGEGMPSNATVMAVL